MRSPQEHEEALFRAAVELPPGVARAAFLDQACAGDPAARRRLDASLAAHEQPTTALTTAGGASARSDEFHESPTLDQDLTEPGPPQDEAVGQTLGRYKLLERVGEGGCGVVYVAEQTEPVRRRVALKVIKLGMDTKQVVARFDVERQALAMMDHLNIAKVLDAGTTDVGRPYFVMELVRGIPITDYCDQARLPTKNRLELFIKVCQAIQHAHQKGIIHRDIKPSNILVTLHDGVPVPKVIDFGIAKATEGRLTDATVYTRLHQLIGTPAYMSPEQAEMSGLDIDTRSDIYSLGVLLYELLAGSTPFDARELMASGIDAMRKTIREKEPPRPSTRLATLGADDLATTAKRRSAEAPRLIHLLEGDLDWIVMKCLEKDRARRYETSNGLAADLHRHLNHEPVTARPPSNLYRFHKLARRNKLVFAGVAAVAAALVVGATLSTWQAIRAMRAEREQNRLRQQAQAGEQAAQHTLARQYLRRGQSLCEEGDVAHGLHWMARAHKEAPGPSEVLKDTIRQNLVAWGEQWMPPRAMLLHDSLVYSVAFSPDGTRVLTGNHNGRVQSWSAETGEPLALTVNHTSLVGVIRFSPDGRRLFTSSDDRTSRISDAQTGEALCPPIQLEGVVTCATFSPDSSRLLTGADDGAVRLWDSAGGTPVGAPMTHGSKVTSVAFSPDGRKVLTASSDSTARLWDGETGEPMGAPMMHKEKVNAAAFSVDGRQLLTASDDLTLRLWSGRTGESLGAPRRHEAVETQLFPSSAGWTVAGFFSQVVGLRSIPLENRGGAVAMASGSTGLTVAFTPDGRRLLVGDSKGLFWWWSTETGEVTPSSLRHDASLYCVEISPDGKRALTGGSDRAAKLWSLEGGERLLWSFAHERDVRAAVLSPDGKLVATGSFDGTARLWSTETGQPVGSPIPHQNMVEDVAFNPDGTVLATACGDGAARLWSIKTGQRIGPVMPHHGSVLGLEFSPDGKRLITGSRDRSARFWNVATGQPTGLVLEHHGWVEDLCFSGDGRRLATVSSEGKIRIWSPETGELLGPPLESPYAWEASFSSDGSRIAASSPVGSVQVWTVSPSLKADLPDPELWVQVLTWQEMDANGVGSWLDRENWLARRQQLEKLGGAVLK